MLLLWQQFCGWCCVNQNWNSQFCLKTRTIYPTQSNEGVKTTWELCLFPVGPFISLKRLQMGFSFLTERDWSQKRCYGNSTKTRVSFCFYCDAHLWCKVSRTLLQYFERYRLFSISQLLVANMHVRHHHWSNLNNRKTSMAVFTLDDEQIVWTDISSCIWRSDVHPDNLFVL